MAEPPRARITKAELGRPIGLEGLSFGVIDNVKLRAYWQGYEGVTRGVILRVGGVGGASVLKQYDLACVTTRKTKVGITKQGGKSPFCVFPGM